MSAPFYYDFVNVSTSQISPSTVHVANTRVAAFFKRRLIQKAMSVYKWDLPENWASNYFQYVLFCWGNIAIINTAKFGVIPQDCTLAGYDVFYRPRRAIITNPLFDKTYDLVIDKDCVLMHLQPDYCGILDTVNYYGDMMALCAEAAAQNIQNSKLAVVFTAANKRAAESFKKMYDQIASGEPVVVQDSALTRADGSQAWDVFMQNLEQNYIADRILVDMRKWEDEFCTVVGIANANTEKRERLISDEVNANNQETKTLAEMWLESLQDSCRRVKEMFGINVWVELREEMKNYDNESDTLNYGPKA